MHIAIMGAGFVGSTIHRYYQSVGQHTTSMYDPPKGLTDLSHIRIAGLIFVAVPTPFEDGFDDSYLREALGVLSPLETPVIIKSTMPPGTTEKLQEDYPHLTLLFNPEFLTESQADADMAKPNRQIVGFTKKSYEAAPWVLARLPHAPFERIVPATIAETVKCMSNSFFALKVAFANQMYDSCGSMGLPYEEVKACAVAEPWMGTQHWTTPHKGGRGYGGKCLPKDTRMTIESGDNLGLDFTLLKAAEAYNATLKKE